MSICTYSLHGRAYCIQYNNGNQNIYGVEFKVQVLHKLNECELFVVHKA